MQLREARRIHFQISGLHGAELWKKTLPGRIILFLYGIVGLISPWEGIIRTCVLMFEIFNIYAISLLVKDLALFYQKSRFYAKSVDPGACAHVRFKKVLVASSLKELEV